MSAPTNELSAPASLPTRAEPLSHTSTSEMEQREEWNKKHLQEMVVVRDLKNCDLVPREYRNTKAAFYKLGGGVRLEPHLSELPPGARSVNHRHTTEAVIYIVKGHGYSLVGWEDDDSTASTGRRATCSPSRCGCGTSTSTGATPRPAATWRSRTRST